MGSNLADVEFGRQIRDAGIKSSKQNSKCRGKKCRRTKKKSRKSRRRKCKKCKKGETKCGKKKNGKSKKKSGKNGRNGRNRNGKRERSERKNQKKNNRGKSKTQRRMCVRQADDSTCMANIALAMDYEGTQVANFIKQKNRIEGFEKLMNNKGGKKENFANSTSFITS